MNHEIVPRISKLSRGLSCRTAASGLMLWILTSAGAVLAGAPEYMKLDPAVGQTLEVEGDWDSSGVFIADDIEKLPTPRKPKLRGVVQKVDKENRQITIFGISIQIKAATLFIRNGGEPEGLDKLKVGQRVEVSCKVNDDGAWSARKIKTHGVKSSDKVKGTVTGVAVDGNPPDTIEIEGLRILLQRQTDIVDPQGEFHDIEDELFPDTRFGRVKSSGGGWLLGDAVLVEPDYRQTLSRMSEYDLTASTESNESIYEHDIRLEANGHLGRHTAAYLQIRMRKRFQLQDESNRGARATLIRPTQLYVVSRIPGWRGAAVQIGRQDFDEPREWLFDEYQDAARFYHYGLHPWVWEVAYIHAVEPIKSKFATWTDIFLQARWYQNSDAFAAAYVLKRNDTDPRNREPLWWGLRYYGDATPSLRPWADLALLRGEDKGDNLDAWACDLGATYMLLHQRLEPRFTLGYAIASGDDPNTPSDETFRQTSYEDNVATFGGSAGFQYYGTMLDPELSNLKVWTVGLGVKPFAESSLDLVYHSYKQHRLQDEITGSDLIDPPARPNGVSDDIGWALDLIVGLPKLWNHVHAKWLLGYFNPGDAFEPRQKDALVNKINVKIGL